ncbi:hypothetical protein [Sphingomonas asaccharolytica]|uniref:hypothetical protein n=1 Tax=Sphingomonas asaccharolytica TaxID=40681 RepID=UPI000AA314F4|nr:hypothetical protein [Sphingomonas asaccharolytica]
MQVISHDELRMRIAIKLQVLKPYKKRELGISGPSMLEEVVNSVMDVLNRTIVVRPDYLPGLQRPGVFGVDEPWPTGCEPREG